MALTVQLSELRTRSLQRAYVPSSGGPITSTEVNSVINTQYRRLYRELARKVPDLFSSSSTITTASGTTSYSKPADWMSTTAILAQDSTNQFRPLNTITESDLPILSPPTGVYSVIHRYVPTPSTLSLDADTIDGICGLDELVVLCTARYIRSKQQLAVDDILLEIRELEQAVESYRPDRGRPIFVTDVYSAPPIFAFISGLYGYQLSGANVLLYSSRAGILS